jgi:hypothetical protein
VRRLWQRVGSWMSFPAEAASLAPAAQAARAGRRRGARSALPACTHARGGGRQQHSQCWPSLPSPCLQAPALRQPCLQHVAELAWAPLEAVQLPQAQELYRSVHVVHSVPHRGARQAPAVLGAPIVALLCTGQGGRAADRRDDTSKTHRLAALCPGGSARWTRPISTPMASPLPL